MIPRAAITFWSRQAPWPNRDQVEQDLVLSRLIVEIASHRVLRDELVFRGGTCLHKVHLPQPRRYSEDLDYVRASHGPIGPILTALRDIAANLGMEVKTKVGSFPKVFLRSPFESGSRRMRIKIEMNTYETSPARPYLRLPFSVESPWWSGSTDILTFELAELTSTKLHALYQRRRGRDLFDLWLALTVMELEPDEILACFAPYRPNGYTSATAIANLQNHVTDQLFRSDLHTLVADQIGYNIEEAADFVIEQLLSRIDQF